MTSVATIGLDIAKSVFQLHGVNAAGQVVIRQRLMRRRVLTFFEKLAPCLVGIEACSSSHYWARELIARGHEVRLMPAQYVKPYVKRGKNDAADAEAICEAVTRPTMRFVPVKTPEQQSVMMLHRVRLMLNRQRTQLSNAFRAHLSEFGIVAPIGRRGLDQLLAIVADDEDARVPADARLCLQMLATQLAVVKQQILENDRRVRASARATELGRRLVDGCIPSDLATGTSDEIEEERRLLYVAMTRAKDELNLVVPQRFYTHQQARSGDRHVYAGRSRFIPASLCEHFRRVIWPAARREEVRPPATNAVIDIRERMRGMWSKAS